MAAEAMRRFGDALIALGWPKEPPEVADMEAGYRLTTTPMKDGKIVQELYRSEDDATDLLARWLADTRDQEIRRALIALGWTPPPEPTGD